MNNLYVSVLATALALAVPGIVQAQFGTNAAPLSRNQVKQQLKDLHAVGYVPGDWGHYPENIQSAQHRLDGAENSHAGSAHSHPMP